MANISIGVIGYGYWGPNIVRNFFNVSNCTVKKVADARPERLNQLHKIFPGIEGVASADDILQDPTIDAVVIVTPVFTHFELARKALLQGKHVLVEKPMTASVAEADELMNLAEQKGCTLMVDHTFLYTGAVSKIKELIEDKSIGTPRYFDSTRINLGLFQPDINVLWDLAAHDLSILAHLIDEEPVSVNATGISHTGNGIENIAYMTVNYASDFIAHFHCSWTSPVKIRQMLIGADKKMLLYNDLEITEKVKVYDTGYSLKTEEDRKQILVDYRTGDIFIPKLSSKEALFGVADDFVQSIVNKRQPVASAALGRRVVQLLEASQTSISNKGKEVKIS
ncbi:MAG: Gfo/Idh/MocA family oxidoreductase [Sphingobacteriales bacterium]|jgi:predicted dehydrogenase|nr:Gfo/Idh/MocA family oxidoreductase [Sphingobacteriales bacterium]NCT76558.1 Gfo/Idh/MocA family oxidoreductase [Chitinophagaceae bacterium]OJW33560.1 MAG: oxidoreductase [Sphingobacteriales bacterium 46-32]